MSENINTKTKLTRKFFSNEEKKKIVEKSIAGFSAKDISEFYNYNYKSVARIINQFNKTGLYENKIRGGDYRSKLNLEQKNQIINWVTENTILTLEQLVIKVRETYNIVVSKSTIDRCLKSFHFTVKELVRVPIRRNCDETIEKRFSYSQEFRELQGRVSYQNIIFLDEVGFSVVTRPKRGRARRGESPYLLVPAARSRNISVLAAMNANSMIFHRIFEKALTGEDFKEGLVQIRDAAISKGIETPVFILDNARIHHYKGLAEKIEELNIKLIYLPPYSPFLNPIENIFSVWKNTVNRGEPKNEIELRRLIFDGFNNITSSHCESFFTKMVSYLNRCNSREIIYE